MENRFYNLPEDIQLKIFLHARAMLLAQVHIELWTNRYDLWSCNGRIAFLDYCEEVDSEVDSENSYSVCDGECCVKDESVWWSSRNYN
jgi:hypothetical protein